MNIDSFNIQIASICTKEKLVAEVWYKDELWIEISQDMGDLIIECYPSKKGHWTFPLEDALKILELAKYKLTNHEFPKIWSDMLESTEE